MSVLYNDKELQEALKEWQHILKLDAWDIRAKICRADEMTLEDAQGENNWVLESRKSVIHIIDPLDYPRNTMFAQDMEQTLVHELLHLHFAPFAPDGEGLASCMMEQTIELLAGILVGQHRMNKIG
ncbi:MAG: hypothetical protein MR665_10285 [Selenomonas bovis]|nr:hypothetical protein [Selenomonas bovis]